MPLKLTVITPYICSIHLCLLLCYLQAATFSVQPSFYTLIAVLTFLCSCQLYIRALFDWVLLSKTPARLLQSFLHISAHRVMMPVSLDIDPASEPHSGLRRLRQLASFGRYGADIHPSVSLPAKPSPRPAHDGNVLASSLSSFYGWLSRQAGHTVRFSSKPSGKMEKRTASMVWIRPCVAVK